MWNWTIPGRVIEMFVVDNDCEQALPTLMGASQTTGEPASYTIEKMQDHGVSRQGMGLMTQHSGGSGSARYHLGLTMGTNGMLSGKYRVSVDCHHLSLSSSKCYLRVIADATTYVSNGPRATWSRLSLDAEFTGSSFWVDLIYNGGGTDKAFWDNIRIERLSVSYPIMHMSTQQVCRRVNLVQ